MKADIVGINETCVHWYNSNITNKFAKILHKENQNHQLVVSSNEIKHHTSYLPGGTASMLLGSWGSRFVEKNVDPSKMGRWSGIKIRAKDNTYIHYITVY
jgi:hypothetical protein